MKKRNRFVRSLALVALAFAMALLTACLSGLSQEECMQDYRERYEQRIIDHFTENEEIFNRIAETLHAYVAAAEDIERYWTISLGNYGFHNDNNEDAKYTLFISKTDAENNTVREYIDILNDSAINIYGLTEAELDLIFMTGDYGSDSPLNRYMEAKCESFGVTIRFPFALPQIYNRADRVEATLWYTASEISEDDPDRINDHWYISYYLYWSPAI
ncbi:MAG: hypothetical protein FWF10_07820 [Clostridiales bacterium]|nr:hypothetical protein [Clostridiales bacterium]